MRQRNFYLVILCCFFSLTAFGQSIKEVANKYLLETAEQYELSSEDLADWVVTDEHISRTSGIQHIYMRQRHQGIEIAGAEASVHIMATGQMLKMNNNFYPDLQSIVASNTSPALSALQAIQAVAAELNYGSTEGIEVISRERNTEQAAVYSKGSISMEDIPVKLVYQVNEKGELRLCWDMSIAEPNGINWWSLRVDATSGEILDRNNWIVNCKFGHTPGGHDHADHSAAACKAHFGKRRVATVMMGDQYNVFDSPVESPSHGPRTIVVDPADPLASPYGWHDTDGQAGAEFTITVGNNVWAQEDRNGNNGFGYSPNGGASLDFDFPLDLTQAPIVNEDANITNLFYWNNIIHDVLYIYGFDEVAGNFQENNYGRGGLGSDHVWGDAQDGSGSNNANFGTPPDGSNPRMQMFLWTSPNPDRDGDLDNGIIVHEYGHGISNRLTGGPSNSNCLGNREQMGEGWSDWYGLMFTMQPGDTGPAGRGIGTYALNQSTTGRGIRSFRYSTDLAVNPDTYDRIKTTSSVHRTGSVWCAMLWELTWGLIDQYGFDPDLYNGTGGNNIAIQLVTEAMKIQPCRPGFVDGRDAILAADVALYDGANACEIWNAFAKRGLGFSATQGSSNSRTDGNEAFDLPTGITDPCSTAPDFMVGINPIRKSMCPGDMPEFKVSVYNANNYTGTVNLTATGLPAGVTATITPSTITTFPSNATLVLDNTSAIANGNYTIEVTGTDNTITQKGFTVVNVQSTILGPPTLQSPANNATEVSRLQNFSWNGVNDATSYDLQISTEPSFTNIVEEGLAIDAEQWTSSALSPNITYYWRMRTNSFCGGGSYSTARTFTIQSCGNVFYDSGGPNNDYDDRELFNYVICPDNAGEFVQLNFTVFDIEPDGPNDCYDHLEVFDGDNLSAPSLGQFCGAGVANAPGGGTIIADNPTGCLTFQFFSDAFVTDPGWAANIICLECIAPVITSTGTTDASCVWSNDGILTANASSANPVEYILSPASGGKLFSTTGTFNNLIPGTYTLEVRDLNFPDCLSPGTTVTIGASNSTVDIIYVSKGANGNNDGSDWLDAYTDLQDALDDAGPCSQVWVASEIYYPTIENPFTTATGSRDQSFFMDEQVGVFGGFAGGEMNRNERDLVKNTTILSGDIGTQGLAADNSWHVVWVQQADATLDGFIISDGQADDGSVPNFRGGGLYNNGGTSTSNPVILDCIFRSNVAD
ncbi:MAG: M36 family metallopeptidase, partial [Bacteroidota bacterium]